MLCAVRVRVCHIAHGYLPTPFPLPQSTRVAKGMSAFRAFRCEWVMSPAIVVLGMRPLRICAFWSISQEKVDAPASGSHRFLGLPFEFQ